MATVEITGEFIQGETEGEKVHIKLEGKVVELLTKLDPKL